MRNILVVIDMQNDFISGSLGSESARCIVPSAVEVIKNFEGEVFATLDTHGADYFSTLEGKRLPVAHCIKGTSGWEIESSVAEALRSKEARLIEKRTFGSVDLPAAIDGTAGGADLDITLLGLDTDICVVSNALSLRMHYPDARITVLADCCAGSSPEAHDAALAVMRSCQIDIE